MASQQCAGSLPEIITTTAADTSSGVFDPQYPILPRKSTKEYLQNCNDGGKLIRAVPKKAWDTPIVYMMITDPETINVCEGDAGDKQTSS